MTDILARASDRLPELVEDIRRLVLQESPTGDSGTSAASAEVVADIGSRLVQQPPDVLNVDGVTHLRWQLGAGPRRVLILAHHDTVWPHGTLEQLPWSATGGILRGPGTFDMKAGLAIALHSVSLLLEAGAHAVNGVTVLVTGDEETGSATSRALIENSAAGCDAVFVLEAAGPGGALKTERKGVSQYTIRITGRASHAGLEPEKGANAAVELAHQVMSLTHLGDEDLGTTVTPTVLSAGTTSNTVPASAMLAVDVRAFTTHEQDRVHRAITALTPHVPGCSLDIGGGPNRPPLESRYSAELFATAQRVARGLGLDALTSMAVGGASDGNFTAGKGIATLDGLGAVGGGAHADDEHVLIDFLPPRLALLTGLIATILEARGV